VIKESGKEEDMCNVIFKSNHHVASFFIFDLMVSAFARITQIFRHACIT
jgi:hypothetical protein